jgi:hypothetical protein
MKGTRLLFGKQQNRLDQNCHGKGAKGTGPGKTRGAYMKSSHICYLRVAITCLVLSYRE